MPVCVCFVCILRIHNMCILYILSITIQTITLIAGRYPQKHISHRLVVPLTAQAIGSPDSV